MSAVKEILASANLREQLLADLQAEFLSQETPQVKEAYILWQPEASYPPRRIFSSKAEAFAVAEIMARKHKRLFNVCRLVGSVEIGEMPVVVKVF